METVIAMVSKAMATTSATVATTATTPTTAVPGGPEQIFKIVDAFQGGSIVLGVALIAMLLANFLRNPKRHPMLRLFGLGSLVEKIPKEWFPLVVTGVTTLGYVLMNVAQGKSWWGALLEGLLGGAGAAGLHENTKGLRRVLMDKLSG